MGNFGLRYGKRSAEPFYGYGYNTGVAIHPGRASSFVARSPQGLNFGLRYGKREADAEPEADAKPEADAYYGYYGRGYGYGGYGLGYGRLGYSRGYYGRGYGLGYGYGYYG